MVVVHKDRIIRNTPYLECIVGPMFSGKSHELARRLDNINHFNKNNPDNSVRYVVLRPETDTRSERIRKVPYDNWTYTSSNSIMSAMMNGKIRDYSDISYISVDNCDIIALDEAQFYNESCIPEVLKLLSLNKHVIICGLDKDYRGYPFSEFMKWALCVCDDVTKLTAYCTDCGCPSTTAELISDDPNEDLSESNIILEDDHHRYVPKCRKHNNQLKQFYNL